MGHEQLDEIVDFAQASREQRFERGRGLPGIRVGDGRRGLAGGHALGPADAEHAACPARRPAERDRRADGRRAAFEGVLELFADHRSEPDAEVLLWLSTIAAQLAQYLACRRAEDALAAPADRRVLDEQLERAVARAREDGVQSALLVCDHEQAVVLSERDPRTAARDALDAADRIRSALGRPLELAGGGPWRCAAR